MGKCSNRKDLDRSPTLSGVRQWRTLGELAATPEFEKLLHDEFPHAASVWPEAHSRRSFLKLMSASLALAGLTGCSRKADENLVPFVKQPEWMVPGKPVYFATAWTMCGYAKGVLVESYDGRPVKIEGNPNHPANPKRVSQAATYGATDLFTQASILGLYDHNRSATVQKVGTVSDYNGLTQAVFTNLASHPDGDGVRLLTDATSSPTLIAQIQRFLAKYPKARWHMFEPVWPENGRAGIARLFGRPLEAVYSLDAAKVIISLDSDFLVEGPANLIYAAQFAGGRRVRKATANKAMNRLFVAESTSTSTGALADVRVRPKPSEMDRLAMAMVAVAGGDSAAASGLSPAQAKWATAAGQALKDNPGAAAVLAGETLSPNVHAAIHKLLADLGNVGQTVRYIQPVIAQPPGPDASLRALVADMKAGSVQTLFIMGGNPVFNAPADFAFSSALSHVDFRVHLGLYYDETAFYCHWHVPQSHDLESWGDARAFEGTASVLQPLIAPLHASKSPIGLMSILLGEFDREDHEVVQEFWRKFHGNDTDFDRWWIKSLNDGVIEGTASPAQNVRADASAVGAAMPAAAAATPGQFEVTFRPDPCIFDGRFATNGWLQETPKPITKLTWDNAALMSPATAAALGVENERTVKITVGSQSVVAPAWVVPGHPDNAVTLHLGYGRTEAWKIGDSEEKLADSGFDVYPLRNSWAMSWSPAKVEKVGDYYRMASTQTQQLMAGREPIKVRHAEEATNVEGDSEQLARLREKANRTLPLSLYKEYDYENDNKWGMVIDQNACIGCNACMVACVAENNIPVVGKDQVAVGRHMHWIRVDAYFAGDDATDPAGPFFQPLPCQQCEKAPCEVVCPVNATVHDNEGINVQVYNRCVGTRYCANNCPYKVRRFNFLQYTDYTDDLLKMQRNPEVTVRTRGIMEKCNYCLQRISHGRIEAKKQKRAIRDGEVLTACQQACPTSAIVFGNLNDSTSEVAQVVQEPAVYSLLEELQTIPRTTYLPRYTNEIKGMEPFKTTVLEQEGLT